MDVSGLLEDLSEGDRGPAGSEPEGGCSVLYFVSAVVLYRYSVLYRLCIDCSDTDMPGGSTVTFPLQGCSSARRGTKRGSLLRFISVVMHRDAGYHCTCLGILRLFGTDGEICLH